LEHRVASLQKKIRWRQLQVVHSHACRQLNFEGSASVVDEEAEDSSNMEEGSCSSLTDSDFSIDISPPHLVSRGRRRRPRSVDLTTPVDVAGDDAFLSPVPEVTTLQREGSSTGGPGRKMALLEGDGMGNPAKKMAVLNGEGDDIEDPGRKMAVLDGEVGGSGGLGRRRTEDSFCSLNSHGSSVCVSEFEEEEEEERGSEALIAQLTSLESLLDGDLTEASSDEEGEESVDLHYK
jgi:hypothetical protein